MGRGRASPCWALSRAGPVLVPRAEIAAQARPGLWHGHGMGPRGNGPGRVSAVLFRTGPVPARLANYTEDATQCILPVTQTPRLDQQPNIRKTRTSFAINGFHAKMQMHIYSFLMFIASLTCTWMNKSSRLLNPNTAER